MQTMADSGELDALTPERVWKETSRALMENHADIYFQTLRDCGALKHLFLRLMLYSVCLNAPNIILKWIVAFIL